MRIRKDVIVGAPLKAFIRKFWPLFVGLMAAIWFLIRVIPKPSRAFYPCQRVAFPIASSFIIWLIGLLASVNLFRIARKKIVNKQWPVVGGDVSAPTGQDSSAYDHTHP